MCQPTRWFAGLPPLPVAGTLCRNAFCVTLNSLTTNNSALVIGFQPYFFAGQCPVPTPVRSMCQTLQRGRTRRCRYIPHFQAIRQNNLHVRAEVDTLHLQVVYWFLQTDRSPLPTHGKHDVYISGTITRWDRRGIAETACENYTWLRGGELMHPICGGAWDNVIIRTYAVVWSDSLFVCGRVIHCFCFSPDFRLRRKWGGKRESLPGCPIRLRSEPALSLVEGVNSGAKACPVRLRSGQALSEGEGTWCSHNRVSHALKKNYSRRI